MRRWFPIVVLCVFAAPIVVAMAAKWVHEETYGPARPSDAPRQQPPEAPRPYDGPQPPSPPPHVLVIGYEGRPDIRRLYRDGWTRTESPSGGDTGFTLSSPDGLLYNASFTAEGASRLDLSTGGPEAPVYAPTDQTDTVLGERCNVWASAPPFQERVYGGPWFSCITADGIVLWTGRGPSRTRVVSLQRRAVAWSEMLPPRELLSWSYWAPHFPMTAANATPAYEIEHVGGVERVRGVLSSYTGDGGYWIRNRNAWLSYSTLRDGRLTMHVRIGPQPPRPPALSDDGTPMDHPPLSVNGESCRWYRIDPEIRYAVSSRCVTGDGIVLASLMDFHDDVDQPDEHHMALSFQRGAPAAASMAPPADLFAPWLAALPPT